MPASTEKRPLRMWAKTEKGTLFHASVDENISEESKRALEAIADAAAEEMRELEESENESN